MDSKIKVLGTPLKLSEGKDSERMVTPPPALGADTERVLATTGVDAAAIATLRRDGVI